LNQQMNKLIAIILTLALVFPATVFADETPPENTGVDLGTFTILKKDQKAPFAGFLFDQTGIAKILAETEFKLLELNLKHDFELQKSDALWQLKLDNSAASLITLQEKHTTLLGIKDNEIERLTKIAVEQNDYSTLWFVGGIILGVGLTVATVYGVAAGLE